MAKSPVKKTSPADKKIAALVKRIKTLENQGFAQILLINELENKLEQVENAIKQLNNPQPFPWLTNIHATPTHACQAGYPDLFGSVACIICGAHMYTMTSTQFPTVTISSTSTGNSTETISDGVDIVWVLPDSLITKE